MKRYLLTQMRNEWKENFWLCLEMIIVSVAVWLITLTLIGHIYGVFFPNGFNVENVYEATIKSIDSDSPSYTAPEDTTQEGRYKFMADDIRGVLARLREKPYIEAVALGSNALPYNYNFYGTSYVDLSQGDTVEYAVNQRTVTPDMPLVLKYESLNGQSMEEMKQVLEKGEVLVTDNDYYERLGKDYRQLLGKELNGLYEPASYKVGGLVRVLKRGDYEKAWGGNIIIPADESNDYQLINAAQKLAIRVKPGMGKQLEKDFRDDPSLTRHRNIIARNLQPMSKTRKVLQWSMDVQVRQLVFSILCLFIIVFLGLLGTFWFRMQQRIGEIAIRKVGGATSKDIFRRFLSEGLILAGFSTLIAWIVDGALFWFNVMGLRDTELPWLLVYSALAVFVMLLLSVFIGIWVPARKAMKIEPAIALKSE